MLYEGIWKIISKKKTEKENKTQGGGDKKRIKRILQLNMSEKNLRIERLKAEKG